MRTRFLLFAATALSALYLLGCTKSPEETPAPNGGQAGRYVTQTEDYGKLLALDIADAKALYVTGGGTTRAGDGGSGAKIHKITLNDQTQEVAVVDENGEAIPLVGCELYRVSDDLIGVYFRYQVNVWQVLVPEEEGESENPENGGGITRADDIIPPPIEQEQPEKILVNTYMKEVCYWIRKSDGAAFQIPVALWKQDDFQVDKKGNLYTLAHKEHMSIYDYGDGGGGLITRAQYGDTFYKIFTDANNGISAKAVGGDLTPYIVNTYNQVQADPRHTIDGNGNLYFAREYDRLHCIFEDGTNYLSAGYFPPYEATYFYDNNGSYMYAPLMLSVVDDGFYYLNVGESKSLGYSDPNGNGWAYETPVTIYKATADAAAHTIGIESVKEKTFETRFFSLDVLSRGNGVVMVRVDLDSDSDGLLVINPTAEPALSLYSDIDMNYDAHIQNSAKYAYWSNPGQGEIFRLDYTAGTTEAIFSNANYDISVWNVSADDVITFDATKRDTLEKVMCEISSGGAFSEEAVNTSSGGSGEEEIISFIRL